MYIKIDFYYYKYYYITTTLSMNSSTEEKIERLLRQLVEMQVIAQNARIAREEERLAQADKFVTLIKDQLLKLNPNIVFPMFPPW
jgi:hypothetical protein